MWMTTSRDLVWDPTLNSWVSRHSVFDKAKRLQAEQIATAAGDSFAGGIILGICAIGVIWTLLLGAAFAL